MTAAMLRRRAPEDIAARARAVLDAALPLPGALRGRPEERKTIAAAALDLDAALEVHGALDSGTAHWESVYPHLSVTEDPHQEALAKAAEETAYAMALLLSAIAALCGTETADEISIAAGGTE